MVIDAMIVLVSIILGMLLVGYASKGKVLHAGLTLLAMLACYVIYILYP